VINFLTLVVVLGFAAFAIYAYCIRRRSRL
jgi:hypothetical protein